jgi:hypothetical protein
MRQHLFPFIVDMDAMKRAVVRIASVVRRSLEIRDEKMTARVRTILLR